MRGGERERDKIERKTLRMQEAAGKTNKKGGGGWAPNRVEGALVPGLLPTRY
jgi:hypothetical protein